MKPRGIFVLALIACFSLTTLTKAEEGYVSPDKDTSIFHFPTKVVRDLSSIFIPENIPIFAFGGVSAALAFAQWDNQPELADGLRDLNIKPAFDVADFYGQGFIQGGVGLGSWAIGAMVENPKLQQFGRDTLDALLMGCIIVQTTTRLAPRTRPDGVDTTSFPSGHVTAAFCFAPVVQK